MSFTTLGASTRARCRRRALWTRDRLSRWLDRAEGRLQRCVGSSDYLRDRPPGRRASFGHGTRTGVPWSAGWRRVGQETRTPPVTSRTPSASTTLMDVGVRNADRAENRPFLGTSAVPRDAADWDPETT